MGRNIALLLKEVVDCLIDTIAPVALGISNLFLPFLGGVNHVFVVFFQGLKLGSVLFLSHRLGMQFVLALELGQRIGGVLIGSRQFLLIGGLLGAHAYGRDLGGYSSMPVLQLLVQSIREFLGRDHGRGKILV